MDAVIWTYLVYTVVSLALTYWVARTLYRSGARFLDDVFDGDLDLATDVNHLLVMGFWLINAGYVAFQLKITGDVGNAREAIESGATKIGAVLVVLGGMHFANLFVLNLVRHFRQPKPHVVHAPPPGMARQRQHP